METTLMDLMRARGIRIERVAADLGLSVQQVRHWFETPRLIKLDKARKLADLLGISLEELVFFAEKL